MKVGILGFSETVHDAPFADASWTFWGMNGLWRVLKAVPEERFALWFELHTPDFLRTHPTWTKEGGDQGAWLQAAHPFPIMMQQAYAEFPSSTPFPLQDLVREFGRDYFTSSVAFEIALALTVKDVKEIGLWGIDLVHGSEWGDQRPCAEFWLGRAEGMGIKVTTHERSALMTQRWRYGYEDAPRFVLDLKAEIRTRAATLANRVAELRAANDRNVAEMQTADGGHQLLGELYERLQLWERGGRL